VVNDDSVYILLSTFNGDQYIEEFLKSLDRQTYRNVTLRIRDDGSRDQIKYRFPSSLSDIEPELLIDSKGHIGVQDSYRELLLSCNGHVAFADQDDIWNSLKLERMMECLKKANDSTLPLLIICNFNFIDSSGFMVPGTTNHRVEKLKNGFVQNSYPGCTMLLNRHLVDLVKATYPGKPFYHDSWTYLCAQVLGEITILPDYLVDYRLHSNNAVGFTWRTRDQVGRFIQYLFNKKVSQYHFEQSLAFASSIEKMYPINARSVHNHLALIRDSRLLTRFGYAVKLRTSFSLPQKILWILLVVLRRV
jgi:rhamnosyltransferase